MSVTLRCGSPVDGTAQGEVLAGARSTSDPAASSAPLASLRVSVRGLMCNRAAASTALGDLPARHRMLQDRAVSRRALTTSVRSEPSRAARPASCHRPRPIRRGGRLEMAGPHRRPHSTRAFSAGAEGDGAAGEALVRQQRGQGRRRRRLTVVGRSVAPAVRRHMSSRSDMPTSAATAATGSAAGSPRPAQKRSLRPRAASSVSVAAALPDNAEVAHQSIRAGAQRRARKPGMAENPEVAGVPAPRGLQAEGGVGDARNGESKQGVHLAGVDALVGTGCLGSLSRRPAAPTSATCPCRASPAVAAMTGPALDSMLS